MQDGLIYGKTTLDQYRNLAVTDAGSPLTTGEAPPPTFLSESSSVFEPLGIIGTMGGALTSWDNSGPAAATVGDLTEIREATVDSVNGRRVVRFPGTITQKLQTIASTTISRPCCIFVVWQADAYALPGNWNYIVDDIEGAGVDRFTARIWPTTYEPRGFTGLDWVTGTGLALGSPRAVCWMMNTAQNRTVRSDGYDSGYGSIGGTNLLKMLGLGNFRHADGTSSTIGLQGWIGEVRVVERMPTAQELTDSMTYFATKWGTT